MEKPEINRPETPAADLEPSSILASLEKLGNKYESVQTEFIRLRSIEDAAKEYRNSIANIHSTLENDLTLRDELFDLLTD